MLFDKRAAVSSGVPGGDAAGEWRVAIYAEDGELRAASS
jgi:hypothetical protein